MPTEERQVKRMTHRMMREKQADAHKGQKVTRKERKGLHRSRRRIFRTSNPQLFWRDNTYDDLINAESALGRTIFGVIPAGHKREFFEYRRNVWIWHESFVDPHGVFQEMTVRYEVRPNGVFKRPGRGNYQKIEGVELNNFRNAARMYLDLIKTKLYY